MSGVVSPITSGSELVIAPSDEVFKALADPTRREILALLRERQRSVGDIAGNFHISRPAVSKHLRQLRAAGLIVDRIEGTARICALNAAPLQRVDEWLHVYRAFWDQSLAKLKTHVEEKARDTN